MFQQLRQYIYVLNSQYLLVSNEHWDPSSIFACEENLLSYVVRTDEPLYWRLFEHLQCGSVINGRHSYVYVWTDN